MAENTEEKETPVEAPKAKPARMQIKKGKGKGKATRVAPDELPKAAQPVEAPKEVEAPVEGEPNPALEPADPPKELSPEQAAAVERLKEMAAVQALDKPQGVTMVMDRIYFKAEVTVTINGKRQMARMLQSDRVKMTATEGWLIVESRGLTRINNDMIASITYKVPTE